MNAHHAPMRQEIDEIHAAYCDATGFKLRLAYDREAAWFAFLRDGFTREDLLLVIAWLRREINAGKRWEASLLFRNLLQLNRFDEDLAVARAHARKPVETPRDKALRELRPVAAEPVNGAAAKNGRDVALRCLENLKKQLETN